MSEEKIITTKNELRETLREVIEESYGSQKFKDSVEGAFGGEKFKDAVMESLVEFNVGKFIPERNAYFENDIKPSINQEIKVSEQKIMDYSDRKLETTEGNIISKINTLTNVLEDKNIIDEEDVKKVRFAAEIGKT